MENNNIVQRKYRSIEKGALIRGIEFKITMNEYLLLHGKPCHYCGIKAIGLDRIDSLICYQANNVVPCCSICNMMKGSLEQDAFLTHCRRITENSSKFTDELGDSCLSGRNLVMAKQEKRLIIDALNKNLGNRASTSGELGISTTTLWRKMKFYNILKNSNVYSYDLS